MLHVRLSCHVNLVQVVGFSINAPDTQNASGLYTGNNYGEANRSNGPLRPDHQYDVYNSRESILLVAETRRGKRIIIPLQQDDITCVTSASGRGQSCNTAIFIVNTSRLFPPKVLQEVAHVPHTLGAAEAEGSTC